jgi:hypothetical protein
VTGAKHPRSQRLVAICHLQLIFAACFGVIMDPFRRCVQDLEAIDRLLELPNGHDIAFEMFRELLPYLWQLSPLRERDPSGALACLFDYAEGMRVRLGCSKLESTAPPSAPISHVA